MIIILLLVKFDKFYFQFFFSESPCSPPPQLCFIKKILHKKPHLNEASRHAGRIDLFHNNVLKSEREATTDICTHRNNGC